METNVETNVKVVGFANQSLNGVTLRDEGFDMEYDGKNLNVSGFSGDKLYYAKLNNKQLVDLLNVPSSDIPLERRIMHYKNPHIKSSIKKIKMMPRLVKRKTKKTPPLIISKRRSSAKYVTPKMRSEYRKKYRHSSKSLKKSRVSSHSSLNRSSSKKTIY